MQRILERLVVWFPESDDWGPVLSCLLTVLTGMSHLTYLSLCLLKRYFQEVIWGIK